MSVDDRPVKFIPPLPGRPLQPIDPDRPVFLAELPGGRIAWMVSGYENVRQMLVDQRFSRALAVTPGHAQPGWELIAAGSINGMDPPGHTRLRKLVSTAFTARHIESLRPRVADIVNGLIDAMLDRAQPADLVASFSLPLPAQVICEMLGVPAEDLEQFHAWSDTHRRQLAARLGRDPDGLRRTVRLLRQAAGREAGTARR
jgi:cytochrome P450